MSRIVRAHLPTLKKTASYYLMHISVAIGVAYAVTGDLRISLTLSLLEPTVQAFAYFFHERAWNRKASQAGGERVGVSGSLGAPGESEARTA